MRFVENPKFKRGVLIAGAVIVIMCLFLVEYVFLMGDYEENRLTIGKTGTYDIKWTVDDEDMDDGSISVQGKAGMPISITTKLPLDIQDGFGVMVQAEYSSVRASVNGRDIFAYGITQPLEFGHMVGNIRCIIPIDHSMAGGSMRIEMRPYYSMNMDISTPEIGRTEDLVAGILFKSVPILLILVFLLMISFFGLILYIFQRKSGVQMPLILHFCGFALAVAVWIFCSSDIPQFFTDSAEAVSLLSFLTLSGMLIPFMGFCAHLLPRGKHVFGLMWAIGWLLPLTNMVCFVFNICDPMTLLPATHIYIIVSTVFALRYAFKEGKARKESRVLTIGIGVIAVAGIIGLLLFVLYPSKGYDAIAFGIGFVVFFLVLLWIILQKQVESIEEKQFISTYNSMAYSDVMTGLGNRTAFENQFMNLKKSPNGISEYSLFLFDIDNLKIVNSKYGHHVGDEIIKSIAEFIKRVFGNSGKCYRIGGDEFAVVLINSEGQEKGFIMDFDRMIERYNAPYETKIHVSQGCVVRKWTEETNFFVNMFSEAEKQMLEMKNTYKSL